MNQIQLSEGVVHKIPEDLKENILSSNKIQFIWEDITPLSRNEWICWVVSAKKKETREKRIKLMGTLLLNGKRRFLKK
jgi:uncharacterized protein YdeI (YjbR/CyaY-like superfamily)